MNILLTGGAGYIGSHAAQFLLRQGHTVVAVDNLSRGHAEAVAALRSQADLAPRLHFHIADIGNRPALQEIMFRHRIEAVIHFAALAYVGESVTEPLRYYRNNAAASLTLLEACQECNVERFIFSSSCAVYGQPPDNLIPIPESCPLAPISPYGRSKLHVEQILADYALAAKAARARFAFAALRYFNVAGCDRSGLLGEDHNPETHLIPVILRAALGKADAVTIFGTDYPTPDGTCIRDYIHVEDLAAAHAAALAALKPGEARIYNLGIGRGYSVRQIIDAARAITGRKIEVKEGPRRPGDPPRLFADPSRIMSELGWSARVTDLDAIIRSAWDWFKAHPEGYGS